MSVKRLASLSLLLFATTSMGAVDTQNKRAASINAGGLVQLTPAPDGTIDVGDRALMAGEYWIVAAASSGGGKGVVGSKMGIKGPRIGL